MGRNKRHRDEGQGRHTVTNHCRGLGVSRKLPKGSCTPQSCAEGSPEGVQGWHCPGPRLQGGGQALAKDCAPILADPRPVTRDGPG